LKQPGVAGFFDYILQVLQRFRRIAASRPDRRPSDCDGEPNTAIAAFAREFFRPLDGLSGFNIFIAVEERARQNSHGGRFIIRSIRRGELPGCRLRGGFSRCGVALVQRDLRQSKLALANSAVFPKLSSQRQRLLMPLSGWREITVNQVKVTQPAQLMSERA